MDGWNGRETAEDGLSFGYENGFFEAFESILEKEEPESVINFVHKTEQHKLCCFWKKQDLLSREERGRVGGGDGKSFPLAGNGN